MGTSKSKITFFNPLDFEVKFTIGKGSISRVRIVKNKKTGEISVWKILCKDEVIKNKIIEIIKNEILLHNLLSHPFISEFRGFGQTKGHLYLNIELCSGGELFTYLRKRGKFCIEEVRFYTAQIVSVLGYLRSKGIVYRDLKPENILLSEDGFIKLSDFGCAKPINKSKTYSVCGTTRYMAPEIIKISLTIKHLYFNKEELKIKSTEKKEYDDIEGYSYSVDYWSLGILLYEFISGIDPFAANNDKSVQEKVLKNTVYYNENFTKDTIDLISKLLISEPENRLGEKSFKDIKNHSFFKDKIDFTKLENKEYTGVKYIPRQLDYENHKKEFNEVERTPKIFEEENDPFLKWFDEFK